MICFVLHFIQTPFSSLIGFNNVLIIIVRCCTKYCTVQYFFLAVGNGRASVRGAGRAKRGREGLLRLKCSLLWTTSDRDVDGWLD